MGISKNNVYIIDDITRGDGALTLEETDKQREQILNLISAMGDALTPSYGKIEKVQVVSGDHVSDGAQRYVLNKLMRQNKPMFSESVLVIIYFTSGKQFLAVLNQATQIKRREANGNKKGVRFIDRIKRLLTEK